jgi:C4-dicarboxylate transporter/malic acid transport protein
MMTGSLLDFKVLSHAQSPSSPSHPVHPRRSNSIGGQVGILRTSNQTLHGNIGIRDRIHHLTWAWFTTTMSTGGIALVLAYTPHRFRGLTTIGEIVFLLDLVFFCAISSGITARFVMFPKALVASLQHPTESLFFPTFWISIANIISNIQIYGVPRVGSWLAEVVRVLFWIYVTCTFLVAVSQYSFLFTGKQFTIQSMTPAWILPVFPVMLSGTIASAIGSDQNPAQTLSVLMAGVTCQGLGMMIAMFFYSLFLGRLMTEGLPSPNLRPGMFIAVCSINHNNSASAISLSL